jgi:hypothetical protein
MVNLSAVATPYLQHVASAPSSQAKKEVFDVYSFVSISCDSGRSSAPRVRTNAKVPIIIFHNKYGAILVIDVLVPTNVRTILYQVDGVD